VSSREAQRGVGEPSVGSRGAEGGPARAATGSRGADLGRAGAAVGSRGADRGPGRARLVSREAQRGVGESPGGSRRAPRGPARAAVGSRQAHLGPAGATLRQATADRGTAMAALGSRGADLGLARAPTETSQTNVRGDRNTGSKRIMRWAYRSKARHFRPRWPGSDLAGKVARLRRNVPVWTNGTLVALGSTRRSSRCVFRVDCSSPQCALVSPAPRHARGPPPRSARSAMTVASIRGAALAR
jgi:hypothetical protein